MSKLDYRLAAARIADCKPLVERAQSSFPNRIELTESERTILSEFGNLFIVTYGAGRESELDALARAANFSKTDLLWLINEWSLMVAKSILAKR